MQWITGIFGILFLAGLVTFFLLWMKERKKNRSANQKTVMPETVTVVSGGGKVLTTKDPSVANASTTVIPEVTARKGVLDIITQS